jgi:hypothetical protein
VAHWEISLLTPGAYRPFGGTTSATRTPRTLLAVGVSVKVGSERPGHVSATITLTVYQHVHPGMGRQAAERFAALLEG